jgi:hypothetical protein
MAGIKSVDAKDSLQYPLEGYAEKGRKGRREIQEMLETSAWKLRYS